MSWAASAALHLPDGAAARRRDAYLARLPEHLAWIHGYDVLVPARRDVPAGRDVPARRDVVGAADR